MADPTQVSGTTLELVVSTTTTGVTAILRINNAVLAGIVSVGALSLGAYYLANRRPVENAVRNGLERRNEAGVVDPEVRNIEEGSILVELHCQTEHSFIQFVEDFEAEKVKHRLEKEFKRIGFSSELLVTIENAYEVNKKVEMIRLSQKGSRTEKVEGGEKSQQPSEQEGKPGQSSERETSEDMLRLEAEVKELKAILSELERLQKESEKPRKEMIDEWEEMKLQLQHVLNKKDTSFQSIQPGELKKPEETRKRETSVQQKEKEELKKLIKQCEQMNIQVEQLQLLYCTTENSRQPFL